MTTDLPPDMRLALSLADDADAVTLRRFQAVDLRVSQKPDDTPVSDADTAVEHALRRRLAGERPGDVVVGEEEGGSFDADADRQWIVDPVDGTKNFIRGVPVWATLIALQQDGRPTVGVVSAPALHRRWWAAREHGAYVADVAGVRRLHVSGVHRLADAFFVHSSLTGWRARGRLDGFLSLAKDVWRTRGFGDFWAHCLVAEGAIDASAEPEVSVWDVAALQVLVEEAGGRFSDLAGRPVPDGGSVVCSNGLLHDDVLRHLGDPPIG